jgi:CBS domain-containing protein
MSDWVFVNQNENVARVVGAQAKLCPPSVSFPLISWPLESDFSKSRQRVAVVDEKQAFVDLVTQSDLISYLAKHQHELGDLPNRPIGSLISPANASIPLVTMSMESPTVHALYMMYEHKVPCIAIVDERKRLVAGISASDLKRIRADNLTSILEPLSKFSFRNLSWVCFIQHAMP